MEILLLGKVGQLGYELRRTLPYLGKVTALDYPEIDFRNVQDLCQQVKTLRPNVIINAAAYTDVDKAEREVDAARQINADAPGKLAELARDMRAVFMHYSTDYVFDGTKGVPYLETDTPHPLGIQYAQGRFCY
jgi:dTDP-4-dehydrorhamnose reductase